MLTPEQENWINHLSDEERIQIGPYDPTAPQKFEAVKRKVQAALGPETRVVHRGATSLGISGQNEIDVYVPVPADQFDALIPVLTAALGSPRSVYPNERARFAVDEEGKRVDVFLINETCQGWINGLKFEAYLRSHPDVLEQYRLHKEAGHGLSMREYYRRKTAFFNEVVALADQQGQQAVYRIAVLADIHGNLQALEAVLADLERDQPLDGILAAGDMIAGPDQQRVLQRLVDLKAVTIQGNNERAIARIAAGTAPEYVYTTQQFSLRRWACKHLDPDQLALISSLPEQTVFHLPGADPIRMAHGSPRDINELILPESCHPYCQKYFELAQPPSPSQMDEIFELVKEPVLIVGHAHLPWCERRGSQLAMNPGAVNFPENGWVGAQYALLHWDGSQWQPEFRAVPYDLEAFRQSNEASGFLTTGILARLFLEEVLSGRDIALDFFLLAIKLAEEAGVSHLPYFPDEVWERAGREFRPEDGRIAV